MTIQDASCRSSSCHQFRNVHRHKQFVVHSAQLQFSKKPVKVQWSLQPVPGLKMKEILPKKSKTDYITQTQNLIENSRSLLSPWYSARNLAGVPEFRRTDHGIWHSGGICTEYNGNYVLIVMSCDSVQSPTRIREKKNEIRGPSGGFPWDK